MKPHAVVASHRRIRMRGQTILRRRQPRASACLPQLIKESTGIIDELVPPIAWHLGRRPSLQSGERSSVDCRHAAQFECDGLALVLIHIKGSFRRRQRHRVGTIEPPPATFATLFRANFVFWRGQACYICYFCYKYGPLG